MIRGNAKISPTSKTDHFDFKSVGLSSLASLKPLKRKGSNSSNSSSDSAESKDYDFLGASNYQPVILGHRNSGDKSKRDPQSVKKDKLGYLLTMHKLDPHGDNLTEDTLARMERVFRAPSPKG